MFTTTCGKCGGVAQMDEAQVPASGTVTKCRSCGHAIVVMPPGRTSSSSISTADLELDLPAPRLPPQIIDLPAPKRASTRNPREGDPAGLDEAFADLVAPVGPAPTRGVDLPAPVGARPSRGSDLLAPVGPVPTRSVDLPAPKGFFDEAPPPRPATREHQPSLPPIPNLDLPELEEDLESVPAVSPAATSQPMALPPRPGAQPPPPPLSLFRDAAPAPSATPNFGEVDLPDVEPDAGVVSFSAPSGPPPEPRPAEPRPPRPTPPPQPLDLAPSTLPRRAAPSTLYPDPIRSVPAPAAFQPTGRKRRRQRGLIVALVVVAVAAGLFLVYENVELTVGGFMTAPAAAREEHIQNSMTRAHTQLVDDHAGHWYRAATAAEEAEQLDLDKKRTDAPGLEAQAYVAAAIDEGLKEKGDRDKADAIITGLLKAGAKGPELQKAEALRSILDLGKAPEAFTKLSALEKADPTDPNLPLYMGWAALKAHNADLAKAAFTRALTLSPDRQPALYGLGRALLLLGDRDNARAAFQKAFDRHPEHRHYGAWLGLIEIDTTLHDKTGHREQELGAICEHAPERESAHPRDRSRAWTLYADEAMGAARYEQAAERYRVARELDADNIDAMVGGALASVELRSQAAARGLELTEARRDLQQALKLDPNHVGALVGLARIDFVEGKPAEARKAIEDALALDDTNQRAHYWHGRILEDPSFSSDEAEKAYLRAIALDAKDFTAPVALSQLYLARSGEADRAGKKDEAAQWTARAVATLAPIAGVARGDAALADTLGNAYLGAKDTAHAIDWFRLAVAAAPQTVDPHAYLATALEERGELPEALVEYGKAHALAPKREDVTLGLASVSEKSKDYPAAEKMYAQLLSTDNGNVPSLAVRSAAGRFYARRELVSLAQQQGQIIAGIDNQNPTGHFLVGYGFLAAGRLVEAQKELRDAVALDPQAQYLEALGRCYEQQKAFVEAEKAFNQAARLDPNVAAPLYGLGRIHLARREFSAAVIDLEKALALSPDDVDVLLGLGEAHFELRELQASAEAYERALALDEKRPETWFRLGKVYFEADNPATVAKLRTAIDKAAPGTPWLPEAYRLLGFRFRATNDLTGMCAAFKKYLELAPPNDLLRDEVKRAQAACP